MLPLLNKARWHNERVRVYICPDSMTVIHLIGRWQIKIIEQSRLHTTGQDAVAGLQLLQSWLIERALSLPIEVIVSSHYCRFIVLPWNEQLLDEQARLNLAQALLSRQYSPEVAADYAFSLDKVHFGQPQLASALAKAWLGSLTSALAQTACQLVSVQPSVAIVWNRFYRELNTEWLVMIEQDRQVSIQQQHGYLQHLEVRPHQTGQALPLQHGLSLFNHQEQAQALEGISVLQLKSDTTLFMDDAEYARYALCGVF